MPSPPAFSSCPNTALCMPQRRAKTCTQSALMVLNDIFSPDKIVLMQHSCAIGLMMKFLPQV